MIKGNLYQYPLSRATLLILTDMAYPNDCQLISLPIKPNQIKAMSLFNKRNQLINKINAIDINIENNSSNGILVLNALIKIIARIKYDVVLAYSYNLLHDINFKIITYNNFYLFQTQILSDMIYEQNTAILHLLNDALIKWPLMHDINDLIFNKNVLIRQKIRIEILNNNLDANLLYEKTISRLFRTFTTECYIALLYSIIDLQLLQPEITERLNRQINCKSTFFNMMEKDVVSIINGFLANNSL